MSYITQFPTDTSAGVTEQMNLAAKTIMTWAITNPAAADQWIQSLPVGSDLQQTAVANYAEELAFNNPAKAATWVGAINDQPTRDSITTHIARTWLKTDPQAATTWLMQTSLPANLQQKLLNSIKH